MNLSRFTRDRKPGTGRALRSAAGLATLLCSTAPALADKPAVFIASAPLVAPATALTYYGTPTSPSPGARQAIVQELARALRYDVDNIYAYIRDNVEYLPMFGLQAGGRGVILNGRGTAFDQAQLMVDLLREADAAQTKGYAPAYKLGKITLTAAQFAEWTGVNDAALATKLLANGGIPATVTGSGSSFTVVMLHCWVQVTIGGTNYLFDPSYKPSTVTAGLNWRGATSYSKSTLLAAAGGTQTATEVRNFNIGTFRAKLNEYRGNIETFLANNAAGKRAEAVVGFSTITPHPTSEDRRTSLPYVTATDRTWTGQVPDIFRTSFTVNMNGSAYATYFADVTAGEVWQFEYQYSGGAFVKSGTPVGGVVAGQMLSDCDRYQSNRTAVAPAIASIAVNHPYAANSGAYADRTLSRQLTAQQCNFGLFYVSNDWGYSGTGVTQRLAPEASRIRIDPTMSNYFTFAPTLASIASQYSAFLDLAEDGEAGRFQLHDLIGIHALDSVDQQLVRGALTTYNLATTPSMTFEAAVSAIGNAGTTASDTTAAYTAALALSYAEGAVPRQETDSVYDIAALSLTTNQDTRALTPGTYTNYLASPGTWATVKTSLSAYPAGATSAMDGYVSEGYSLLAPEKGALRQPRITVASTTTSTSALWEGIGPGSTSAELARSSFLAWRPNPGGGTIPDRIALVLYDQRRGSILKAGIGVPIAADTSGNPVRKPDVPKAEGKDFIRAALNVDGRSGAVTYAPAPDLVDGTGEFPRSINFQRLYDQRDQTNYGLGMGWKHNWHQVSTLSNDGQAALGRAGAQAIGSILVTIQALGDLVTTQDAQNLYAALQVASWMTDQTIDNSAVMSRGLDGDQTFYRQANGTTYVNSKPDGSTFTVVSGAPQNGIINRRVYANMTTAFTDNAGTVRNYETVLLPPGTDLSGPAIASIWTRKSFNMKHWSFPNGAKITTVYTGSAFGSDAVYPLRIYNNLGNAIYLGNDPGFDPGSMTDFYFCTEPGGVIQSSPPRSGEMQYRTSSGTEARFVTTAQIGYFRNDEDPNCPPGSQEPPMTRKYYMSLLGGVRDSLGKTWGYGYQTVPGMFGGTAGLNVIRKPSNVNPDIAIAYGLDANARTMTNLRSKIWRYYSTSFRSEVVTPEQHDAVTPVQTVDAGQGTATYFDRYAQPIRSVDPLSRVTLTAYDGVGRPIKVTQPEGNAVETQYDARSNVVTQTEKAKPGSGLADQVSTTAYVEGPSVTVCSNLKTCNKPAYWIDARGTRTSYAWVSTTGELSSIRRGLNAAGSTCLLAGGTCPETTFGFGSGVASYDPYTGAASGTLYFPLSKTDLIQSGVSRIASYGYVLKDFSPATYQQMVSNVVKKVVPREVLVDSGGLNLRSCYDYDIAGNIISGKEPLGTSGACP